MISEAKGQGMTPQLQKNMLSMIETFQEANLNEYNQLLHSRVDQAAKAHGLDTGVVLNRVAPSAPTPIQEALKKVEALPSKDKEAIDWAHKILLEGKKRQGDSTNYEDALQILKMHGL